MLVKTAIKDVINGTENVIGVAVMDGAVERVGWEMVVMVNWVVIIVMNVH